VDLSYSMLFQIAHDSNKAMLLLDLIGGMGLTLAKMQDPVGLAIAQRPQDNRLCA